MFEHPPIFDDHDGNHLRDSHGRSVPSDRLAELTAILADVSFCDARRAVRRVTQSCDDRDPLWVLAASLRQVRGDTHRCDNAHN